MTSRFKLPFSPRRFKVALGAALAAFVLGGAGVALAAAESPSHSPSTPHHTATTQQSTSTDTSGGSSSAFGQQVKKEVATCKAARPTSGGHQGIGKCVSAWVKAHNPSNTNGHGATTGNTGH